MSSRGATIRRPLAGLLLLVTPAAADARPMTVDDTLAMVRVDDAAISPDGQYVVYSERRLDWDANEFRKNFFVVSVSLSGAVGEARPVAGEAGGRGARFSPDSRSLALLRETDDGEQVFRLSLGGGEAVQLTHHRGGVEDYRFTPDGRRLVFLARERRDEAAQEEWDKGADAVFVHEGPNGQQAGFWNNLWLFDLEKKEETRLTDEEWIVSEMDVAPDGGRVALVARPDNRDNHPELAEIYLVDVDRGRRVRLTRNRAPEEFVRWSPDGKSIAYHAPDAETHVLTNGFLWVLDPATLKRRRLAGQDQGELHFLAWTPDSKALLFAEVRRTNRNLYRLDLATEELTALTRVQGTLTPHGLSRDGSRMVYTFEDFTTPPDLHVAAPDGTKPVRLTRANPWSEEIDLARGEVLPWPSSDVDLEAVLLVPGGWEGVGRLPLVLNIQGGPGGYWGNQFDTDFHVFAGLGYASLAPNIRGSSAYGDDVLRALMGDVGGVEFDDLMVWVDHVVKRGVADPERLAVRGWSWGGVLGAWTIAHTDRFRAASLGGMVGDWATETGPGLMWDLREHYIGGQPWERPEEWHKHSALTYVSRVKTPTILLHGELDRISTVDQSMTFFTALEERGIPTRFIKFPRQGHDVEEPRLLRICKVEEIRWIQKYVLGKDWEPGS